MAENPPSEYVPHPQAQQPQPPAGPPQFPGGGTGEAPYRAYVPRSRTSNWTLAIIGIVVLVLAIPALFLFIGVFSWAMGPR